MTSRQRISKIRRLQELLTEGKVAEFQTPEGVERIFVTKANSYERDEAQMDGRGASARAKLAWDANEDQQAILTDRLVTASDEDLVTAVAQSKENEFYVESMDEVRTRKDWAEKLLAMDRGQQTLNDRPAADTEDEDERSRLALERRALNDVQNEFIAEVEKLMTRKVDELKRDLSAQPRQEIEKQYRDIYRENIGTQAFLTERRITELFFAIRDCNGEPDETKPDGFDHSACNSHLTRLIEHRHQVHELPDVVVAKARETLDLLAMSPADAAFSDAPTSSSDSSEHASEGEGSTASSQDETQPEPAGT